MSEEFHDTLDAVIKCVNYVKARPLNQRLFSCLFNEMGSDHIGLLLHSEARWLSRGHVLKRIVELQEEVNHLFKEIEADIFSRTILSKKVYGKRDIFSRHI